jgi:hypothetical protein
MGLPDPPPDEEDIRAGRREKGINALGAYALGFMTHALLDRAAHPYIVYKSGWVSPKNPETLRYAKSHAFFERILDVLMLKRLRGEEASGWDQEGILAGICGTPPLGLKELLARALVLAFPERAGKDEKLSLRIENTFADCRDFYLATDPRRTSRSNPLPNQGDGKNGPPLSTETLAYVFPENLPPGTDFLNLEKKAWYYPAGENRSAGCRSFPEVYDEVVKSAAGSLSPVITEYLVTGIFPIKEAAQAIGNGGLSIIDKNGKPCAPTRSEPLPLDEVLEDQARQRGLLPD